NMDRDKLALLPDPQVRGGAFPLSAVEGGLAALDRAEMILWGASCGVHTIFREEAVHWWQNQGWRVLVHPESPLDAVQAADGSGSTAYLWQAVLDAKPGDKLVIGTEGHFVRNAAALGAQRGVSVRHLLEIPGTKNAGCGCATMSRNDPPHLAGLLDLLRLGQAPDLNRVIAGDSVDELTGERERLGKTEREELTRTARQALERMIAITEGPE
ncbi:MAG TPA: hypothetical protein EYQ59_13985, partial [Planctomycetes bacterium]|nr:hypothetical protein [Planctomycetota bacterium]